MHAELKELGLTAGERGHLLNILSEFQRLGQVPETDNGQELQDFLTSLAADPRINAFDLDVNSLIEQGFRSPSDFSQFTIGELKTECGIPRGFGLLLSKKVAGLRPNLADLSSANNPAPEFAIELPESAVTAFKLGPANSIMQSCYPSELA